MNATQQTAAFERLLPKNYWLDPRDPEKFDPEPSQENHAQAVDQFYSDPFELFERINDRMQKGVAGDFYGLMGRYFYQHYKGEKEAEGTLYWINRHIGDELYKVAWDLMEKEALEAADCVDYAEEY